MLSQITNQKVIKIWHLDVAKDRLKDKILLVVLDDVGFPSDGKALKIFGMYVFAQKSPYYGFESLARKVTQLADDRSLISIDRGWIRMHNLLARLGREVVRKQSIHGLGQRQFLVDRETCRILSNYTPIIRLGWFPFFF
ncbi:unnamed protein product [Brassica rapa subsp. narinosa]